MALNQGQNIIPKKKREKISNSKKSLVEGNNGTKENLKRKMIRD